LEDSLENITSGVKLHFEKSGDDALIFLSQAVMENHLPGLLVLDLRMPSAIKKTPALILSVSIEGIDIPRIEKKFVSMFQKPKTVREYGEIAKTMVLLIKP
jgi:hypothetical protein